MLEAIVYIIVTAFLSVQGIIYLSLEQDPISHFRKFYFNLFALIIFLSGLWTNLSGLITLSISGIVLGYYILVNYLPEPMEAPKRFKTSEIGDNQSDLFVTKVAETSHKEMQKQDGTCQTDSLAVRRQKNKRGAESLEMGMDSEEKTKVNDPDFPLGDLTCNGVTTLPAQGAIANKTGDREKGDPKGKAGRCETHHLVGGPIMLFEGSVIETLDEIKSAPNTSLYHRSKLYILTQLLHAGLMGSDRVDLDNESQIHLYEHVLESLTDRLMDCVTSMLSVQLGGKTPCGCGEESKIVYQSLANNVDIRILEYTKHEDIMDLLNQMDVLDIKRPSFTNRSKRHLCDLTDDKMMTLIRQIHDLIKEPIILGRKDRQVEDRREKMVRDWHLYRSPLPSTLEKKTWEGIEAGFEKIGKKEKNQNWLVQEETSMDLKEIQELETREGRKIRSDICLTRRKLNEELLGLVQLEDEIKKEGDGKKAPTDGLTTENCSLKHLDQVMKQRKEMERRTEAVIRLILNDLYKKYLHHTSVSHLLKAHLTSLKTLTTSCFEENDMDRIYEVLETIQKGEMEASLNETDSPPYTKEEEENLKELMAEVNKIQAEIGMETVDLISASSCLPLPSTLSSLITNVINLLKVIKNLKNVVTIPTHSFENNPGLPQNNPPITTPQADSIITDTVYNITEISTGELIPGEGKENGILSGRKVSRPPPQITRVKPVALQGYELNALRNKFATHWPEYSYTMVSSGQNLDFSMSDDTADFVTEQQVIASQALNQMAKVCKSHKDKLRFYNQDSHENQCRCNLCSDPGFFPTLDKRSVWENIGEIWGEIIDPDGIQHTSNLVPVKICRIKREALDPIFYCFFCQDPRTRSPEGVRYPDIEGERVPADCRPIFMKILDGLEDNTVTMGENEPLRKVLAEKIERCKNESVVEHFYCPKGGQNCHDITPGTLPVSIPNDDEKRGCIYKGLENEISKSWGEFSKDRYLTEEGEVRAMSEAAEMYGRAKMMAKRYSSGDKVSLDGVWTGWNDLLMLNPGLHDLPSRVVDSSVLRRFIEIKNYNVRTQRISWEDRQKLTLSRRVHTFLKLGWPYGLVTNPISLAIQGFVKLPTLTHSNHECDSLNKDTVYDAVECCDCRIRLTCWAPTETAESQHQLFEPHCPYAKARCDSAYTRLHPTDIIYLPSAIYRPGEENRGFDSEEYESGEEEESLVEPEKTNQEKPKTENPTQEKPNRENPKTENPTQEKPEGRYPIGQPAADFITKLADVAINMEEKVPNPNPKLERGMKGPHKYCNPDCPEDCKIIPHRYSEIELFAHTHLRDPWYLERIREIESMLTSKNPDDTKMERSLIEKEKEKIKKEEKITKKEVEEEEDEEEEEEDEEEEKEEEGAK